jgi:hypothetical protein
VVAPRSTFAWRARAEQHFLALLRLAACRRRNTLNARFYKTDRLVWIYSVEKLLELWPYAFVINTTEIARRVFVMRIQRMC